MMVSIGDKSDVAWQEEEHEAICGRGGVRAEVH